jgi:hypothetical protein
MTNIDTFKKTASILAALGALCVTNQAAAATATQGGVIINEWNAVGPNKWLEDSGCDLQFSDCDPVNNSDAQGNGDEWVELVVITDGVDLRGLTLEWQNGDSPAKHGYLDFNSNNSWRGKAGAVSPFPGLEAGTIILIRKGGADGVGTTNGSAESAGAEYFPDAATIASGGTNAVTGAWNKIIYVNSNGSYITERTGAGLSAFQVDNDDWMARLHHTSASVVVQTWVGEDTSAADIVTGSGLSSEEVGKLEADPSADAADLPQVCDYNDGDTSTAGFPNQWNSGLNVQCFKGLTGAGSCTPSAC